MERSTEEKLRVVFTGSRHWVDVATVMSVLEKLPKNVLIVHGDAIGADTIVDVCAKELGLETKSFPVTREDWKKIGLGAGHVRNRKMLFETQPHVVIAFHDDSKDSPGTLGMIELAESYGFKFVIVKPLVKSTDN